jgi:hypothetical protein
MSCLYERTPITTVDRECVVEIDIPTPITIEEFKDIVANIEARQIDMITLSADCLQSHEQLKDLLAIITNAGFRIGLRTTKIVAGFENVVKQYVYRVSFIISAYTYLQMLPVVSFIKGATPSKVSIILRKELMGDSLFDIVRTSVHNNIDTLHSEGNILFDAEVEQQAVSRGFIYKRVISNV